MSYYTHFQIARDAEDIEAILNFIKAYAQKKGWHEDCISGFRDALETNAGSVNKIYGDDLTDLVRAISTVFPRTWFGVRGFGEEFRDIWIREFRAGEVIFSNGPFDEE